MKKLTKVVTVVGYHTIGVKLLALHSYNFISSACQNIMQI